jgi:hypothetical protein
MGLVCVQVRHWSLAWRISDFRPVNFVDFGVCIVKIFHACTHVRVCVHVHANVWPETWFESYV